MTQSRSMPATASYRPPQPPQPAVPAAPAVHVVHVIGWLNRGGAETLSLDLCRAIPSTMVRQTFVTLAGQEGSLAAEFRATGAAVLQCPLRPLASLPLRLWRCLRELRPDVVVSHVSLPSAVVLLIARTLGVRVRIARMWSEADGRPDTLAQRARRALLRRLLHRVATEIVAVSDAALAFAGRSTGTVGCRILYNSVDTARVAGWTRAAGRRKWGLPQDAPVIGYIGRAAAEKNRPYLVDVHRAVRGEAPATRLLIVGPAGTDDVTSAHPDVRDDPSVVLGGETDEIASVLAASDVFVLPSRWEGLPGVVLEALAAGVPVVATNLPCLREASRYVDGLTLLDLSDGPQRWAAAVAGSVRTSPADREAIRARFATSPFQTEHAVTQWLSLWRVAG
ncbi:glycosyltransferase family 4 protein [Solwaraspora sp. WMMB335]|uniref:glycosyltransferase family 4 protein n=1 Tax=Solwaraspora sp. WMMB335 TaxID=3404118 RepID=UPI003B9641D4